MRTFWSLLPVAVTAACSGETVTMPPASPDPLPSALVLEAEASGEDAGLVIECTILTIIELTSRVDREPGLAVQYGSGGGDANRYIEHPDGNAISFWAHTAFEDLRVHLIGADSIEIRSPLAETTSERFWHEFTVFPGHTRLASESTGEVARGTWTCRPMDTPPSSGEYYDPEGSVPGTWVLTRQ